MQNPSWPLKYINEDIAVIGAGIVTPTGIGIENFNVALKEGRRQIDNLINVPTPRNKGAIGKVSANCFNFPNRASCMALQAIKESLVINNITSCDLNDAALFVASIGGNSKAAEDAYKDLHDSNISQWKLKKLLALYPNNSVTSFLARELHLTSSRIVISNACASGNIALGLAMDHLRLQQNKIAIVVGVENYKLSMVWGAERSGFIGRELRPFDEKRDGTILGEGAAAVILSLGSNVRGKNILGYLQGFGCVCDRGAEAITLSLDGDGLCRSMKLALKEAEKNAEQVEYINAHAPGTPLIDLVECRAIVKVGVSLTTPVNSTKSLTTHLSGASPIAELIATLCQMKDGYLHPNVGLKKIDPKLPIVPMGSRSIEKKVSFGISNACGGGGLNTSVAISSFQNHSKNISNRDFSSRLVITGLGSLIEDPISWTVLNGDLTSFKENLHSLQSFNIYDFYPKSTKYHYMNKAAQICAAAGALAFNSAFKTSQLLPYANEQVGVIAGTYLGGSPEASWILCERLSINPDSITPNMALDHGVHLGPSLICRYYNLIGLSYTITGGQSAGFHAISAASSALFAQRIKAAIVVGFDSSCKLQTELVNRATNGPAIEFTSIGAAVVIEQEEQAKARGAIPVCYIHRPKTLGDLNHTNCNRLLQKISKELEGRNYSNVYLASDFSLSLLRLAKNLEGVIKGSAKIYYFESNCRKMLAGANLLSLTEASRQSNSSLILSLESGGLLNYTLVEPYLNERI